MRAESAGPEAGAASVAPPWRAFSAMSLGYFASIGLFGTYAPLWFSELGYSAVLIGLIAAVQAWSRVVAPYAWGWMADHSGRRVALIRLAASLSLVWAVALAFAPSPGWVAAAVLALYLCNGAVVPLSESALAHYLTTGPRTGQGMDSTRYGRIRVWGSIGFILAVTLFGALLEWWGIGAFPVSVIGMLALLVLAAWRLPATVDQPHAHAEPPRPMAQVLREPRVVWFFGAVGFTVLAHTALYSFFTMYVVHLGYSKPVVGLLWAVSVAVEILFFTRHGAWYTRRSPVFWLLAAALLTAVRLAVTAGFGDWMPALVAAQLTHAITFAAQHLACTALLARYFPGRLRSRGQALYSTLGYGVPGVVGGLSGGWLLERAGYGWLFGAAAGAALVGAICAWQLSRLEPDDGPAEAETVPAP